MANAEEIIVRDYRSLISALDRRRNKLGLPTRVVDYVGGIADGLTSKIMCGTRGIGPVTLGVLLETLGLELVVRSRADMENKHENVA